MELKNFKIEPFTEQEIKMYFFCMINSLSFNKVCDEKYDIMKNKNLQYLEKNVIPKINSNITTVEVISMIANNYQEAIQKIYIDYKEDAENLIKFENLHGDLDTKGQNSMSQSVN